MVCSFSHLSFHIAGCTAFPDAEVFAMAAEQSLLEGHQILTRWRLISTRQRHGDFVLGPRAYRRQRGLSGRGNTLPGRQRYSGEDGNLLPAKRFVSNDTGQNHASLKKLAERLKSQTPEIQFMEFAHSGPLPGIVPLLNFANNTPTRPPAQ
jgi:hypothetical protein